MRYVSVSPFFLLALAYPVAFGQQDSDTDLLAEVRAAFNAHRSAFAGADTSSLGHIRAAREGLRALFAAGSIDQVHGLSLIHISEPTRPY